jgi:DNA polymerase bacteriophage-type
MLFVDFETRSELSLPDVGLDNYVRHPSTSALMLAYAFDDGPVELFQPHIDGQFSGELRDAITDPSVIKVAFNAPFERSILQYVFRTETFASSWIDVLIWARHLSVTGDLGAVGKVFGLPEDEMKDAEGKRLIRLFCEPAVAAKEMPLFGPMPAWFEDWDTRPEDWARFCKYCRQDVVAERSLLKRMQAFPLPETEQRGWELDQAINSRGLPMDLDLVSGSKDVAELVKSDLWAELKGITGVENPNSGPQMLEWLKTQGYTFSGIGKPFVNRALAGECDLTPEARKALEIRKQSSKTSDAKLQKIVNSVSGDGRLRHQFLFMGAPRTGRWSGGGGEVKNVQMQNLPRPSKEVSNNLNLAITLLKNRDYTGIAMEFSSPMDVVTSTLRSTIKASPGKKLLVCDLNAVEFRALGWITRCESIQSVFRTGRDPYKDFGADLFGVPYEEITKQQRQDAKPGVLGGGYQLSGGEEMINEDGDKIYTGLMGYARSLQIEIEIDHDLAHDSIARFREKYWEVKDAWREIEECALRAVRNPSTPVAYNDFTFECFGTKLLRLMLPSGRGLHYIRPKIEMDEKFNKPGITYEGRLQTKKAIGRIKIYGGKWVENMCQAFSRDLLLHGMFEADKLGLPIVGTTHDEIICEVDENSKYGLGVLRACMIKTPVWAPGLILDAEGYEANVYRKD